MPSLPEKVPENGEASYGPEWRLMGNNQQAPEKAGAPENPEAHGAQGAPETTEAPENPPTATDQKDQKTHVKKDLETMSKATGDAHLYVFLLAKVSP